MAQKGRGVVARSKGAPVTIETSVVPDPGPGEAVVKGQACGLCHTDLLYREGVRNERGPGRDIAALRAPLVCGLDQFDCRCFSQTDSACRFLS